MYSWVVMVKIISDIKIKESDTVSTKKLEKEIIKMLQENTGSHILDSGGAYGRHWERNQKLPSTVKFWDNTSQIWLDMYDGSNPEIYATISIYHHLKNSLIWDDEVTKVNRMWDKFWRADEDTYKPWHKLMEEFWEKVKDLPDYDFGDKNSLQSGYTYNDENSLSQDFTYIIMGDWVFIQIHNGCDARGGFTTPKLFKFDEYSLFSYGNWTLYCDKTREHCWDFYNGRCEYGEEIDWKDISLVGYSQLSDEEQTQFDRDGYLEDSPEIIYAEEGQINLPGIEARLKKPPIIKNAIVIKDREAFCFCGGKLHSDKYWGS